MLLLPCRQSKCPLTQLFRTGPQRLRQRHGKRTPERDADCSHRLTRAELEQVIGVVHAEWAATINWLE
jgi:hypothetical protein